MPAITLLSINIGKAVPLAIPANPRTGATARSVVSGIRKLPVSTLADPRPIQVGRLGLAGDEQADLTVHGGLDKALYAYPVEHYGVWRTMRKQATQIDAELAHGSFGENLTISGLLETDVWVGDIVRIGAVRLRITAPRAPCYKFNAVMGFAQASQMMIQSAYTGFYLEVLDPGAIGAGATLELSPGQREMRLIELHRHKHSRDQE